MKNQNAILKTALLLAMLAMATACSRSSTEPNADLSSRATPVGPTLDPGTASQKGLIAECNQKIQDGIVANVQSYQDSTGKYRDDYMKFKFLQVPISFVQGGYFEFFRWKVDASGKPVLDSTPVQARFETMSGVSITEFSSVTYWGQVASLAASWNVGDPSVLMRNVRLVIDIRDVKAEYEALKVVYYSPSNQVLSQFDMLLPAFKVNPTEYANDNGLPRSATLQALHPFAGTTATAEQLLAVSKSYCF